MSLKNALKANNMEYGIKEKDGAFYGPKIDFQIKDSMGREWQCATIQLDYQQPKRFGLSYTGEDGKEHEPVMIHRVIYGSARAVHRGAGRSTCRGGSPPGSRRCRSRSSRYPTRPRSTRRRSTTGSRAERVRVRLDSSDKTLQYKIREAQMQQVPYVVVLGKKEQEAGTVTIRDRNGKQTMGIKLGGRSWSP